MRKENEIFLITKERKLYKGKLYSCSASQEKFTLGIQIIAGGEMPDGLVKMKDFSREYSVEEDSGIIFEN